MMFMWGAGGLVMMLTMLVFWGLLIAGLVLGVRWLLGKDTRSAATKRSRSYANATREARSTSKNSKRASVTCSSDGAKLRP